MSGVEGPPSGALLYALVPPRRPRPVAVAGLLGAALALLAAAAAAQGYRTRWSGNLLGRYQAHTQAARFPDQPDVQSAAVVQLEYYVEGPHGSAFTLSPYVRAETHEDGDTFTDLREALWLTYGQDWELRAGIGKVFWGVTESVHLVDIINQSDVQEDVDGEEKLGQPLLQGTVLEDWGAFSVFLLPYFRTRELPELGDRPRFALPVDNDAARFESDREERHVDAALRYTRTRDALDLGLSYFTGTAREPLLVAGDTVLVPFYPLIDQVGLDLQYTAAGWLWKLEAIHQHADPGSHSAAAGGFECTFVGVLSSVHDLGLLAEYLYDTRAEESPTPFENDLMLGTRWVWNDAQSTELLLAVIGDLDGGGQTFSLEGRRRLGHSFKLSLEARGFARTAADPQLATFADDDYVRLDLAYYF